MDSGIKKALLGISAEHNVVLIHLLKKADFQVDVEENPVKFLERVKREHYDVCILYLSGDGVASGQMVRLVKGNTSHKDIKILLLARQVKKSSIQEGIESGAHDFLSEKLEPQAFFERVRYHLMPKKVVESTSLKNAVPLADSGDWIHVILEATEILSRTAKMSSYPSLHSVLRMIAVRLDSNRTSLVAVERNLSSALVLASSDDPTFHDFTINLRGYPEIQHVFSTGNLVLIDNVDRNNLTSSLTSVVKTIEIGSLMVFPVRHQNEITGVLTIRRVEKSLPPNHILRILQALANIMAAQINLRLLMRRMYQDHTAA